MTSGLNDDQYLVSTRALSSSTTTPTPTLELSSPVTSQPVSSYSQFRITYHSQNPSPDSIDMSKPSDSKLGANTMTKPATRPNLTKYRRISRPRRQYFTPPSSPRSLSPAPTLTSTANSSTSTSATSELRPRSQTWNSYPSVSSQQLHLNIDFNLVVETMPQDPDIFEDEATDYWSSVES